MPKISIVTANYNNEKYTINMMNNLNFKNVKDMLPMFRDSLIYFEK